MGPADQPKARRSRGPRPKHFEPEELELLVATVVRLCVPAARTESVILDDVIRGSLGRVLRRTVSGKEVVFRHGSLVVRRNDVGKLAKWVELEPQLLALADEAEDADDKPARDNFERRLDALLKSSSLTATEAAKSRLVGRVFGPEKGRRGKTKGVQRVRQFLGPALGVSESKLRAFATAPVGTLTQALFGPGAYGARSDVEACIFALWCLGVRSTEVLDRVRQILRSEVEVDFQIETATPGSPGPGWARKVTRTYVQGKSSSHRVAPNHQHLADLTGRQVLMLKAPQLGTTSAGGAKNKSSPRLPRGKIRPHRGGK